MSLKSGKPTKTEGSVLFISTKSDFHRNKLEESSGKNEILIALEKVFQQPIQVQFTDLTVKLEPTITASKTQSPTKEDKSPSLNDIAEEVFTFID